MAKETYYFQHDYEPTSDPKIQAMLSEFGATGYGLYWRTVEMLHSDCNHTLPKKQYIFMALAKQMDIPIEQVILFITQSIEVYELFHADSEFFWSERVLRNIDRRNEISEKRSRAGQESARKRAENATSAEQVSTSVEQNSTKKRKGNKNKLNKSKEDNTTAPELNIAFDRFWDLYEKKTGMPKSKDLWERLTDQERSLAIDHIPKYKESQPDKQFRKNPATYLNNKSFNDEIIESNGKSNTGYQQKSNGGKHAGMSDYSNEFSERLAELGGN